MFFSGFTLGPTPKKYQSWSAERKRSWHVTQGESTPYARPPGRIERSLAQSLGMASFLSKAYLQKTVDAESGYPTDPWRKAFGKIIHNHGVMAPGEVTLKRRILGLPPGKYPATYRFSLANPHVPGVYGAEYRPGFLVIFHRDEAPDVNLFLMPEDVLDGFPRERNPFSFVYSSWLKRPKHKLIVRIGAMVTFARVSEDVYTQFVDGPEGNFQPGVDDIPSRKTSPQLFVRAETPLRKMYDQSDLTTWRERFLNFPIEKPLDLFQFTLGSAKKAEKAGDAVVTGPWLSSRHSDFWFARHTGFILI